MLLTCVGGRALIGADYKLDKLDGVKGGAVSLVLDLERLVFSGED